MLINKLAVRLLLSFILIPISFSYVSAQSALPHFFPEGVVKATTPAKQWQEWARYANATQSQLANANARPFVGGSDVVTVTRNYFGQDVKIVFDQHVRVGDKIRYSSFDGQYFITKQQFDALLSLVDKNIKEAVEIDFTFWNNREAEAVEISAKAAGKSVDEFRSGLDKEDPLNPGITFRNMRHIPTKLERRDFVPFRELHIGLTPEMPTVLGVAWLNAGIVFYTPVAIIRDYLMGYPGVLAHEFIHSNKKLQGLPLVWGFNAETFASIPEMLLDDNYLDLQFHGYAETFRELIWVYFGYDFDRARKEIVKYDLVGNIIIDEEKFEDYSTKLLAAKRALLEAMTRATSVFYSEPIWWTALNDKLTDKESVLRVIMSTLYNPTMLGGEDATMKWYETNKSKISAFADEAFKESGSSSGGNEDNEMERKIRISKLLFSQLQASYNISDEDIDNFLKFYKTSSADVFSWGPEKLKQRIENYIVQSRLQRRLQ